MQRSHAVFVGSALLSALIGCGFSPVPPAQGSGTGGSMSTGATGGSKGGPGAGGSGLTGLGGSGFGGSSSGGVTGGGGDVGLGTGGMPNCGQTNVTVMPEPPDILIVQDKSLSMNDDASGATCNTPGCSKWSQVSTAIDTVVMATQTTVNWGLMFFGSDNMCGVSATPIVPITPTASYAPISQAYANNMPSSYTPTAAAVNAAVTYMQNQMQTDSNPKYLLLATDGLPNCKTGDRNVMDDDSANAETAVATAKTAGFPTFVVGIGNTMGVATLNQLAMNGGEPQVGSADGNSFYEVNSTADLVTALNKIVGLVASCTIPLTGVNGTLEKVAVSAQDASGNTVEIMQDPTNGWSYTDTTMTAIILNGTACSSLQAGTLTGFQFIYTCSTGIICIDRNANGTCAN